MQGFKQNSNNLIQLLTKHYYTLLLSVSLPLYSLLYIYIYCKLCTFDFRANIVCMCAILCSAREREWMWERYFFTLARLMFLLTSLIWFVLSLIFSPHWICTRVNSSYLLSILYVVSYMQSNPLISSLLHLPLYTTT